MDQISESKNKNNTNTGEQKTEAVLRLSVSQGAERCLVSVMDRVNNGFNGGKVNRMQVANWIFDRFAKGCTDQDIRDIRAEHFDEVSVLESLLRKAKETGSVPSELREILQKELRLDEPGRKKARKTLQSNIINDDIPSNE